MKQIIRCASCDKLTKFYGSYKVKVRDRIQNPLTGEYKNVEYEGKICPECNALIYPKKGKRGGEKV